MNIRGFKKLRWGAFLGGGFLLISLFNEPEAATTRSKENESYQICFDPQTQISSIKTTGVGFAPHGKKFSGAQQRLMAKRAATVFAYRNLLKASRQIQPCLPADTFIEEFSGYLKGVETLESRFCEGTGKAEVDMILPLGKIARSFEETKILLLEGNLFVYEIDSHKKTLTKEEYEQLFFKNNKN